MIVFHIIRRRFCAWNVICGHSLAFGAIRLILHSPRCLGQFAHYIHPSLYLSRYIASALVPYVITAPVIRSLVSDMIRAILCPTTHKWNNFLLNTEDGSFARFSLFSNFQCRKLSLKWKDKPNRISPASTSKAQWTCASLFVLSIRPEVGKYLIRKESSKITERRGSILVGIIQGTGRDHTWNEQQKNKYFDFYGQIWYSSKANLFIAYSNVWLKVTTIFISAKYEHLKKSSIDSDLEKLPTGLKYFKIGTNRFDGIQLSNGWIWGRNRLNEHFPVKQDVKSNLVVLPSRVVHSVPQR